ncbi:hypothetical protein AB0J21_33235 [Streptomyces sp. NPDC049954]|uniref:hypothetical protein n=1 Tax=Streptomyces sp. NPDC049954 TaxID=3155779 RepID=UPI0034136031
MTKGTEFMNPVVAAALVLALLAAGEVCSVLTRARVPGFLVAFLALFALVQSGALPRDIVDDSTWKTTGNLLAPALMVHLGTMIPLRVMRQQYRAVLVAVCGMVGAVVLVAAVVTPLFGYAAAVAGAGPVDGGLLAYLITDKALRQAGQDSLVAVPLLVFVLQQVVGLPLVTSLLRRQASAVRLRSAVRPKQPVPSTAGAPAGHALATVEPAPAPPRWAPRWLRVPPRFAENNTVLLFLVLAGGACATGLEDLTGVNYGVWGLGIGLLGSRLGVYPVRALEKANGFTIAMTGLLIVVLANAATLSPGRLAHVLPLVATIVVTGVTGLALGGYAGSRCVGWPPAKGMVVAMTALLGFPLDYLTTQEVARGVGRDESERQAILDDLLAPMLIGGFTTVSTGSVIIAGLLVKTL